MAFQCVSHHPFKIPKREPVGIVQIKTVKIAVHTKLMDLKLKIYQIFDDLHRHPFFV